MTLRRRLGQRLTRRKFLSRAGLGVAGAGALVLLGCGEDQSSEQAAAPSPRSEPPPEPTQSQDSESAAELAQEQDVVEAQQQGSQEQPELDRGQPDQQAQQAQQVQQTEQRSSQAQPIQQAQSDSPAERRLLVPNLLPGEYKLEAPEFDPVPGARADFGVIDGAGYRIELPEQWNGELVLWAHGFRGLNDEGTSYSDQLTFDDIPARDVIIGQGYGWATSTYRVNGYVPGVGVDDLLRVKDRVAEVARPPSRTFIAGGSMGGATAQLMAQEFPEEIAAALAFCPAMGNIWVVDYIVAWHALAHYLIGEAPQRLDVEGMIEWSSSLGTVDDAGLQLTPAGEQFAALIKEFTGGERWGFAEGLRQQWYVSFALGAVLWPDIVEAGQIAAGSVFAVPDSQPPADTRNHVYTAAPDAGVDLDRLNTEVIRASSSAERRNDPGIGLPSGQLTVPMLTMTTTGDLFTPIHLTRDYQKLLNETGSSAKLVVQPVRRAGHCSFSERESLSAFTAIVAWLGFGLAPPGDDLQGDLSSVGTRFTNPFDEDDPLGPSG